MISRMVLNGHEMDLRENTAVPVTLAIADIKDPINRQRSVSKSTALPGTQNNMDFFSSTYQLSLSGLENDIVGFKFDPTQRVEVQYYDSKGKRIFDGLAYLISVEIVNKDYSFNVAMFSSFVSLNESLGKMKVSELPGWEAYNHILNNINIKNSWDTSVMLNGVATPNFTAGVPDGYGYLYPLCHYGYEPNLRDHRNNNLFPHVYAKEVMEKCFAVGGQTIDSNLMNTARFKRLNYGWGGGPKVTISTSEASSRRVNYTGSGTFNTTIKHSSSSTYYDSGTKYKYTYGFNNSLELADGSGWSTVTILTDTLMQLDENTGDILDARSGMYAMHVVGELTIDINIVGSILYRSGDFGVRTIVYKNGAEIGTFNLTLHNSDTVIPIDNTVNLNLVAGDVVELKFKLYSTPTIIINSADAPENAPYIEYQLSTSVDFNVDLQSIQSVLLDGDTVNVANFIPDMLCSDFVKGIIIAFNLYVSDPDIDNVVKIETLDDFFNGTDVFDDWSLKIDHSKKQTIVPAANFAAKNNWFKFMQDDDYYNKLYRDTVTFGIGYGDYNYQGQTFNKEDRIYQLPWPQTVPVEVVGTNLILPTIINVDPATNAISPYKGKGRIYYYQGLNSCDAWKLRNSAVTTTFETLTSYPANSHVDNYTAPTFDFGFGVPSLVYWTATAYTIINLFSEYTEKFVREMNGKDAKIYTPYVQLNSDDVQLDKLRTFAMVNGVLFRKNIIKDFDDNVADSFPVELIRIIDGDKRRSLSAHVISATITRAKLLKGGNDVIGNDANIKIKKGEVDSYSPTSRILFG